MEIETTGRMELDRGVEILPRNFSELSSKEAVPILERAARRLGIVHGKKNEFWNGVGQTVDGMAAWIDANAGKLHGKTIRVISGVVFTSTLVTACQPAVAGSTPFAPENSGPTSSEILPQDFRREPQQILENAFTGYENMRISHPELGKLEYHKPANYLGMANLLGKVPTIDGMETNDTPYSSFLRFSVEDIGGPKNLIELNPGSGILNEIAGKIEKQFGSDPYANPALLDNPEVQDLIKSSFSDWFIETQNFLSDMKSSRKATASDLLTHFLIKNNGDIMNSLWDTTLFLKVAARNDPNDLSFGPVLNNVKLLARNIEDDFGEQPLSGYLKIKGDPYAPNGIVAQAGVLYHGMNDIALEGCMDKTLVELALRGYYLNKGGHAGEAEKMAADLRVAGFADEIIKELQKY